MVAHHKSSHGLKILTIPELIQRKFMEKAQDKNTPVKGKRSARILNASKIAKKDDVIPAPIKITTEKKRRKIIHIKSKSKSKKRIRCNVCEYSSKMKGKLKRHMRKHTVEKPYRCNGCLKRFLQRSEKAAHVVHCTAFRYECYLCLRERKIFDTPNKHMLVAHMRKHTGERPWGCNICRERFNQKGNLKTHLAYFHGIQVD